MDEKAICSAEIAALAADMENQEMADGLGTCLANAIKSTEEFKVLPRNGKSGILTYTGELVKKAYNSIKDAVANNGSYEFDLTECEEQANQIAQDGGNLASKMCGTIKSAAGKIYDMVKVPDGPVNPEIGGFDWKDWTAIIGGGLGTILIVVGGTVAISKIIDKRKKQKDNIVDNAEFGPEAGATKIVSNRTEGNAIQPGPNNNLDQGEEHEEVDEPDNNNNLDQGEENSESSSSDGGDGPDNGNDGRTGNFIVAGNTVESDIISTQQKDQQLPIFEGKAMDSEDQKKFDEEFKLPEEKSEQTVNIEKQEQQNVNQQETVNIEKQEQQSLAQQDNKNVEEPEEKEQISVDQLKKDETVKSHGSRSSITTTQSQNSITTTQSQNSRNK